MVWVIAVVMGDFPDGSLFVIVLAVSLSAEGGRDFLGRRVSA
jgi:hypothetical protein